MIMKRMLTLYTVLVLLALGLMLLNTQWGGLALLATLVMWFLHGVFASTGVDSRT